MLARSAGSVPGGPGQSGGNHHCSWPLEGTALLRKLFNARPALSYSFAASEVHPRHDLKVERASRIGLGGQRPRIDNPPKN